MNDTLLTNARIVMADDVIHGTLTLRDGHIAAVDPGNTAVAGATDLGGDMLIPGLIELHTDNLERHIEPRPGVDWPHAAGILAHDGELASTGITTVFDALRVGSIQSGGKGNYVPYARKVASEIMALRTAGALRINHYVHLRAEICSETLIDELETFGEADRVGIVSLMDHTPGQRQFSDIAKFKQYIANKRAMNDGEFESHVHRLIGLQSANGTRHEAAAVAAAGRLGAVLASHDDTTRAHVQTSAGHGIRLAEFPTTREAAEACHETGIQVMMGAPNLIRGGSHSGNVAARELAEAGLLDIVSSDYVPSALMTSAFRLADLWDDLPRALATVTTNPAKATGLTDRGRIAPGLHGDLVRVGRIDGTPVVRGVWCHGRQVG